MNVEQLKEANDAVLAEINVLLDQLGGKKTSLDLLTAAIRTDNSEIWVAREEGAIVGMATIAFIVKTTGTVSVIEDVVVHESQRGKGLGKQLCEKLIERARARGARSVSLTSRPERVAGNALYKKLGFQIKETNVYRLPL